MIGWLTKVTAGAPRFAPGWEYLAMIYADQAGPAVEIGSKPAADVVARARHAIGMARQLDPNSARALFAEAELAEPDDYRVLSLLDQAIGIDPNVVEAHKTRAAILQNVGRMDAGVRKPEMRWRSIRYRRKATCVLPAHSCTQGRFHKPEQNLNARRERGRTAPTSCSRILVSTCATVIRSSPPRK